jgi:glycosyltransferase involved in cell wall biosynthesis
MKVILLTASTDVLARELAYAMREEGVDCTVLALRTLALEDLVCPSLESQFLVVEGSKDKVKSFSALLSRASELAVTGESLVHALGLWPFGICASLLKSLSFIPYLLSVGNEVNWYPKLGAAKGLSETALRGAYRVLAPSEALSRELRKEFRIEEKLVEVVPCSMGLERFASPLDVSRKQLGIEQDDLVFLYVGDVWYTSGLEQLLLAFKLVSKEVGNAKLLIAAPGVAREAELAVRKIGLERAAVAECVSPSELPHYYAACDVFVYVNPSDLVGRRVLEAMTLGKPVVAVSGGAAEEYVRKSGGGVVVEPFNVRGLANAMLKLARSEEARGVLGARGREWASRLPSGRQVARLLVRLYEGALVDSFRWAL